MEAILNFMLVPLGFVVGFSLGLYLFGRLGVAVLHRWLR